MSKIPLVIKVEDKSVPAGNLFEWSSLTDQMPTFTRDIKTPSIGNINIGAIVSGMPTIFARANLFKLALDYKKDGDGGLMGYYASLIEEWRGLIACIALDYSRIAIERIELKYSDGESVEKTGNIYEPKGAFGNLLFDRKPLWCDQKSVTDEEKTPFIDVIKYQDKVVGATSPDSFLFSSVGYKITEELPWVAKKTGKFIDPLKSDLTGMQIKSLYAYIKNILANVNDFRVHFENDGVPQKIRPQLDSISGNLEDWKTEIENKAKEKSVKLDDASIPQIDKFLEPFNILFNHSDELYIADGVIYETKKPDVKGYDPKNLLLDKNSEIACFDFGNEAAKNPALLSKQPTFFLKANVKGMPNNYQYFALPLSPLGLESFGKNIAALIGMDKGTAIESRMVAEFDPEPEINNLRVTLTLKTIEGKVKELEESYTVAIDNKSMINNNDILIWPNFISKQWNKYFMYSELPHNEDTLPFKATPFVGDVNDPDFKICMQGENVLGLAENGKINIPNSYANSIKAKLHVVSDSKVADNRYKYEIYESNQPFKGVRLNRQGKESGYLIIRYSSNLADELPLNQLNDNKQLSSANLGVDFGSTNTSVAYYSNADNVIKDKIVLKNRQISLFSLNNRSNGLAMEKDIFFFQNKEIQTNSIRSILTIHDQKRINEECKDEAVKGGFPCFAKNLPIKDVESNRYKLLYKRVQDVEMVYNMKWKTEETESVHKKSYLSSLLLHIYAQMFEEKHYPKFLKWSYPSSMNDNLLRQYADIWSSLKDVKPLVGDYGMTVYNSPNISNTNLTSGPFNKGTTPFGNGSANSLAASRPFGETKPSPSVSESPFAVKTTEKNKSSKIETGQDPIKFDFIKLSPTTALTEACAVANFIDNRGNISTDRDYLTLCFDVGGSTTDISVLCRMGGGLAMIKQNSIRFAAQRLSTATKYSPNFERMLKSYCDDRGLKLNGLNDGEDRFSENTAPYFFEQVVDQLGDTDFSEFYRRIHTQCPELMSVNLYVTGLIMFYAGQLTYKLIEEIRRAGERDKNWKALINIVFAGKGSRIFDWYKSVAGEESFKNYFNTLFIEGLGGMEVAEQILQNYPNIKSTSNINDDEESEVKYEVSKGLAYPTNTLLVPSNYQAIEILGEDGFVLDGEKIPYNNAITPEMMEVIEDRFWSKKSELSCPQFRKFSGIFYSMVNDIYQLSMDTGDFEKAFDNMNICSYIRTLPEFKDAEKSKQSTGKFDFVAPIIILEGMKFYDDYLLKGIARQQLQAI